MRGINVRRPRRIRRWAGAGLAAAAVSALAFTAASCGGSSGSEPAEGQPGGTAAADTGEKLPGTREFGLTDEEFVSHVEQSQSLIATCMAEAGFEYIPAPVETVELAQANVRKRGTYEVKKAYKMRWGYDVSTRVENKVKGIELGPQNLAYIAGLSEADRVAYERTLYGEDPNATFAFSFDEEDFSGTGGCTRKAVEQVFTREQLTAKYVNPKDVLIEGDPRVVQANADWVTCMQAAGYNGYLEQDEIIDELEERYEQITEGEDPRTLTGSRATALQELQADEIALSLADLDCEQPLDDAVEEVEIEVYGRPISE
jgi:hypothetical protein